MHRRVVSLSALLIGAFCLLMVVITSIDTDQLALLPASVLLAENLEEAWP